MKPLFEVVVQGADEQTLEVLRAGGIPWVWGPPRNQSGDLIVHAVFALVEADTAEAARERLIEKLPPDGEYRLIHVHPIERD
jgi:hypothetical protein